MIANPGCDRLHTYVGGFDCATFGFSKQGDATPIGVDCGIGPPGACFGQGVDETRADWAFVGSSALAGCNTTATCPGGGPGNYGCGAFAIGFAEPTDPGAGVFAYGADMSVQVSPNAQGIANVGLVDDVNETFLTNVPGENIDLVGTTAGVIEVIQGTCCTGVGPDTTCDDTFNITVDLCEAAGGAFDAGGDCAGILICGDDCLTNAECADGDACTMNACVGPPGLRVCDLTPTVVPDGSCCDPATSMGSPADLNGTGSICQLDNSNECVLEACSNGDTSGFCQATVLVDDPCAGVSECFANGVCQADGSCVGVPINTVSCFTIANCPSGATGCDAVAPAEGFCECCVTSPEVSGAACVDGIDNDCDGLTDSADPDCGDAVPTVSVWGLIVMALLLLAGAKVYFNRYQGVRT